MSIAPVGLVEAARQGRLDNLKVSVLNQNPLVLQQIRNTPDPGGGGTVWELNKVSTSLVQRLFWIEKRKRGL
jgi:hypothetical protein